MADEKDPEIITLSSDEESKPQVTSPKLSLKRNRCRADISPDKELSKETEKEDGLENGKRVKLQPMASSADNLCEQKETLSGRSQVPLNEDYCAEKENRTRFLDFLEYSKTLMDLDTSAFEKEKITKRMLHELNNTQQWYPSSVIFSSLIDSCWKKLKEDGSRTFNILFDMKKEIKRYRSRLKSSIKDTMVQSPVSSKTSVVSNFNHNDSTNSSSQLPLDNRSISEVNDDHFSKKNVVGAKTDFLSNVSLFSVHSATIPNNNSPSSNRTISPASTLKTHSKLSQPSVDDNIVIKNETQNSNKISETHLVSKSEDIEPLSPVPSTSKINSVKEIPKEKISGKMSPDLASENTQLAAIQADRNNKRIQKLETTLRKLDNAIKKLQNKELTLDDMDDAQSNYMLENQYKKRFVKIYNKLCQLQKVPSRTGRIVEKKFIYEGSRYKLINSAIQNLINKKKSHEKFPDFSEVLNVVKLVNKTHDVGMNERAIFLEAERVFKDIGMELQIRRCRDDEELFGCYLTDNFDPAQDPAEHDERLRSVLVENNRKFEASINELIDSYVEKQKTAGENEDNEKDNEEEEEEEDDDDKEDNDNKGEGENEEIIEEDLPSTNPASPAPNGKDSSSDDVVEIQESDQSSTDPNDDVIGPVVVVEEEEEEKSSDDDLPTLQELLGR